MKLSKLCIFAFLSSFLSFSVQACESPWLGNNSYDGDLRPEMELSVATGEWLEKGAPNALEFVPVRINQILDGRNFVLDLCVGTDYLKFSEQNLYAAPGMDTVRFLEERWNVVPPTPHLVDVFHAVAQKTLDPSPRPPSSSMTLVSEGLAHLNDIGFLEFGRLISGHKKDIVLSERLIGSGKIAIYGWIKTNGKPVQPLNLFHHAGYGDYSHGFRPILSSARVNGEETTIRAILRHPEWHKLLNPNPIENW